MDVQLLAQPAFVIWRGRVLVHSAADAAPVTVDAAFIGTVDVVPVLDQAGRRVAYILEAPDESSAYGALNGLARDAIFVDVMFVLGRYTLETRSALMRAIAIERWSNRYRFCPACGTALGWTTDFDSKICTNEQKVHRHFPRLDPAIIVLVTRENRALLGRGAHFPPGFYSTLAGFVAPGESLETAIEREVFEEAGIRIGATRYFGSEPWPFPRSLMLGFFAEAQTSTITLHDAELEDARWFDRRELRELQAQMKGERPFFDTIARRLIDCWLGEIVSAELPATP